MNKNKNLVLVSMYVSLAIVLDYIKAYIPFLNMHNGGSINIALIPVVFASFHLGIKKGLLTGFLWWLLTSILGLNNYYISIAQYVIDYILPSVIVGAASIFYHKKTLIEIESGILLVMIIRTILLVISGAIFWMDKEVSNTIGAWTFSIAYNLPYSILTLIMLMIIIPILIKAFKSTML